MISTQTKLEINKNKCNKIVTEWGNATLSKYGYYVISSNEKGYIGKRLHRLYYCKYHNCSLQDIKGMDVHHKDGNKLNCAKSNLVLISHSFHSHLTHKGRKCSDDTKMKMSLSRRGKNNPNYNKDVPLSSRLKMSEKRNTSGYFRVRVLHKVDGDYYTYSFMEKGKTYSAHSNNIYDLECKVRDNGWIWHKFD